MLDNMRFILLIFTLFILPNFVIGVLVALPTLIPPVRRLGRRSATARVTEIFTFGLLSLVLSFGLWTRLTAEVTYAFGAPVVLDPEIRGGTRPPEYRENESAIINEIWVRQMIPPPWQRPCYTKQAIVCDLADDVVAAAASDENGGQWNWRFMGLGALSALTSTALVGLFTRQRQVSRGTPPV